MSSPDTRPLFLIPVTPPASEEERGKLMEAVKLPIALDPASIMGTVVSDRGDVYVRIRRPNAVKPGTFVSFDFPLISESMQQLEQQLEPQELPQS